VSAPVQQPPGQLPGSCTQLVGQHELFPEGQHAPVDTQQYDEPAQPVALQFGGALVSVSLPVSVSVSELAS
jgi:hypothetical protein